MRLQSRHIHVPQTGTCFYAHGGRNARCVAFISHIGLHPHQRHRVVFCRLAASDDEQPFKAAGQQRTVGDITQAVREKSGVAGFIFMIAVVVPVGRGNGNDIGVRSTLDIVRLIEES